MSLPGQRHRAADREQMPWSAPPEAATGFATVGVTWDARPGLRRGRPLDLGAHPARAASGRTGRTCTTTPTTGPTPAAEADDRPRRHRRRRGRRRRRRPGQGRRAPTGATPEGLSLADRRPRRGRRAADDATTPRSDRRPAKLRRRPHAWPASPSGGHPEAARSSPARSGAPTSGCATSRSLHYGEIHAGFVHHTVNANDYARATCPRILRGIYAYHTQSRGWSDVGYNFLVDRFGRIWEGRYGGVDRPVVGAHTLGYNDDAFAMSAIGNFETVQPSPGDARRLRHGSSPGSCRCTASGRTTRSSG